MGLGGRRGRGRMRRKSRSEHVWQKGKGICGKIIDPGWDVTGKCGRGTDEFYGVQARLIFQATSLSCTCLVVSAKVRSM